MPLLPKKKEKKGENEKSQSDAEKRKKCLWKTARKAVLLDAFRPCGAAKSPRWPLILTRQLRLRASGARWPAAGSRSPWRRRVVVGAVSLATALAFQYGHSAHSAAVTEHLPGVRTTTIVVADLPTVPTPLIRGGGRGFSRGVDLSRARILGTASSSFAWRRHVPVLARFVRPRLASPSSGLGWRRPCRPGTPG